MGANLLARIRGQMLRIAAGTNGQLLVGQTDAKPAFKTVSGGGTLDADGVLTLGRAAFGAATSKTVASGAIALTAGKTYFKVLGEGGVDDNLDQITGGAEGDRIILRASSDSQTITLRDKSVAGGSGNIITPAAASIALAEDDDFAELVYAGTDWTLVSYKTLAADIVAARIGALAVTTPKIAAQGVTFAKAAMFVSTEQTGTGAPQNVAHGLGAVPAAVLIVPTEHPGTPDTGAFDIAEGAHDGTNVIVTVTANVKFKVWAMV